MKKNFMKPLILILFAVSTLGACKKSKDAPAFTKENVTGKYAIGKVTFQVDGAGESDITSYWLSSCEQDDFITLKSDLTYTYEDAGVSCGNDAYDGEWNVVSSTKFSKDGEDYDVVKWDGKTLAVSFTYNYGGSDGKLISYFTKQ